MQKAFVFLLVNVMLEEVMKMKQVGLTSVTFRGLSIEEIIKISANLGLTCIEWGSDVHIKPDDQEAIAQVMKFSKQYQIQIASYGSYYKLCQGLDPKQDFQKILSTAIQLEAPVIRVWAGRTASKEVDKQYYKSAAEELQMLCDMAKEHNIQIGLEYHRKSLTDTSESTLKLIELTNRDNLYTYWQVNPELSVEQNIQEIKEILPYLLYVHVFCWQADNSRLLLEDGVTDWQQYINLLGERTYLFEFVLDDSLSNLKKDVMTMKGLLCEE